MSAIVRMLAVAGAMTATAATAIPPPPPPPPLAQYGPLLACEDGFAIAIAADEALQTPGIYVRSPRGSFLIDVTSRESLSYQPIDRREPIEVDGLGRVERLLLTSQAADQRRVIYLFDTATPYYPLRLIGSDRFDGTDRDLTILRRISAGEAARMRCAATPVEQRSSRERADADAVNFVRQAVPGPQTYCMAQVAIDLRPGEAARRQWIDNNAQSTGRIESAEGSVTLAGFVRPQGDEPTTGPIAAAGYRLRWSKPGTAGEIAQNEPAAPGRMQFTIYVQANGMSQEHVNDIASRLRWRTSADRCLPAVDQRD